MLTARDIAKGVTVAAEAELLEIFGKPLRVIVLGLEKEVSIINGEDIVAIVEKALRMNKGSAGRKSRVREIVELRQICFNLMRKYDNKITLLEMIEAIGGGFDHTTVVHNLSTAQKRIESKDTLFIYKLEIADASVILWLQEKGYLRTK